jgi:addiction module HigA family antidote
MSTINRTWPDVAIPPGETLAEEIEARGMSQSELARQMNRPVQAINEIINGGKAITAETALQLEEVLGIPGSFWVRLEADYRYNKARLAGPKRMTKPRVLAARSGATLVRKKVRASASETRASASRTSTNRAAPGSRSRTR